MDTYKRHRFPPDIISYAVWLYYRFNLSHRDIEDLLAERGITVTPFNRAEQSHEATRMRERGMRKLICRYRSQCSRLRRGVRMVGSCFVVG
jgi:transposase-like protein